MDKFTTFEQGYPQYPFAELVRLLIGLGDFVARLRARREDAADSLSDIDTPCQGRTGSLPLRQAL